MRAVAGNVVKYEIDSINGKIKSLGPNGDLNMSRMTDGTLGTHGAHKFIGGLITTGRTSNVTGSFKQEVEADYSAVKLAVISHESTASTGYKAVVSSTETAAIDTQANAYQPVVGGVTYNALRTSTANYGWDAVTWSGNATGDCPSGGAIGTPKYVESDWIPSYSVPRKAGEASTRPLSLIRVYKNGAIDTGSYQTLATVANMATATADNRGRIMQFGGVVGADGVGTLGATFSASTTLWPVIPIYRYNQRVIQVAAVGDSLTQGYSYTADGVSTWLFRACCDLSTPGLPIIPQNYGYSGQTSATYLAAVKVLLPITKPDIAFFAPFSPNDLAAPTQRSIQDGLARSFDFVDFCARNNIYPILWTPFPNDGYDAAADAARLLVRAKILALVAAKGIGVADFGAILNTGASPDKWQAAYRYDDTHCNNAGIEQLAVTAVRDALLKIL